MVNTRKIGMAVPVNKEQSPNIVRRHLEIVETDETLPGPSVLWSATEVTVRAPGNHNVEVRWLNAQRVYLCSNYVRAGQTEVLPRRSSLLSVTLVSPYVRVVHDERCACEDAA